MGESEEGKADRDEDMDLLGDFFIRPKRSLYSQADLGPVAVEWPLTTSLSAHVTRYDFTVYNRLRKVTLACSAFVPRLPPPPPPPLPQPYWAAQHGGGAILYLHGNAGSRLEAMEALPVAMALGWTLACFDFGGSGLSTGDYITLSHLERSDVDAVVDFLTSPDPPPSPVVRSFNCSPLSVSDESIP